MIRTHDGKNMTKSKDEIDPRLLARRLLRVPDVHAHVLVVENCVAGRQKVDEAKEMPLELLDEDPALVEEVAEDDIAEDDEHHAQREAVLVALREQETAGIDIVTDGEQGRQHFVHGFLEHVEGVDFARRVTIGIRGDRYKAEVPTVTGPLRRRGPAHAAEVAFARAHTTRKLKFTLPGPMTIVDTLADEHYRDRRRLALEFARLLNEEARELAALGLDVLQLDEPAFNVYLDDVAAWGLEALHRAIEGVRCTTAVHICYG